MFIADFNYYFFISAIHLVHNKNRASDSLETKGVDVMVLLPLLVLLYPKSMGDEMGN